MRLVSESLIIMKDHTVRNPFICSCLNTQSFTAMVTVAITTHFPRSLIQLSSSASRAASCDYGYQDGYYLEAMVQIMTMNHETILGNIPKRYLKAQS